MELSDKVFTLLTDVSLISVSLPLFVVIWKRKLFKGALAVFAIYVITVAITELLTGALGQFEINNHPVLHIFVIVEFAILSIAYYWAIHNLLAQRIVVFGIICFTCFSLYYTISVSSIYKFNSIPRTVESIYFIGLTFYFFLWIVQNSSAKSITMEPMFWINSGVLIYFAGSVILYLLTDVVSQMNQEVQSRMYSVIHSLSNIAFNLALARGLWMVPNTYQPNKP